MKATRQATETSLTLLSIIDDLDNEVVLAGGLLSAIAGLEGEECSGWEYQGTQRLALNHVERLREILADLSELHSHMRDAPANGKARPAGEGADAQSVPSPGDA